MKEKRYRFVSVKGLKMLGIGGHGKVYRLSEDSVIKVYHDESTLDVIEREREYARTAFVEGIPGAITFDTVITEEGFGTIFELAGGDALGNYMNQNKEKIDAYTDRYADLIKQFHETKADKTKFPNIKEEYIRRIKDIKYFNEEEKKVLIEVVNSVPDGDGYVHSDIHPNNILINEKDELMIIDMADLCYGHGIFDVGGCYMTLVEAFKDKKAGKAIVGLDKDEAHYVYRRMLSRYYGVQDEKKIDEIEAVCALFGDLRMVNVFDSDTAGWKKFLASKKIKSSLIKHKEKYIAAFREL